VIVVTLGADRIRQLAGLPADASIGFTGSAVIAWYPEPATSPSAPGPASWTPDERYEWEESIALLVGVTIVDVDDWCQAKDKPVAERAGVEGRAKMLAYFTSAKGGDSVRAYIAQKKPATNAGA